MCLIEGLNESELPGLVRIPAEFEGRVAAASSNGGIWRQWLKLV